MLYKQYLGFLILLGCCLLEVSSKPTDEQRTSINHEVSSDYPRIERKLLNKGETLSTKDNSNNKKIEDGSTEDILEKIKLVNENLNKHTNNDHKTENVSQKNTIDTAVNEEILRKISELILIGKLQPFSVHKKQDDNYLTDEDKKNDRDFNSRALQVADISSNTLLSNQAAMPFLTSMPVLVIPSQNYAYTGYPNNFNRDPVDTNALLQTRLSGSMLRGQIQWPFAQYFPILIKDPLVGVLQGGGLQNFVEYGQQADVCSRKHKSLVQEQTGIEIKEDYLNHDNEKNKDFNSRQKRDISKQTISDSTSQLSGKSKKPKKIYSIKPISTPKPVKKTNLPEVNQNTKNSDPYDGDLRFPFGDFSWFGNKKPVAPSPGFFINKLRVRKGGVAIAGPGGVATAGRGGTAIVGPGGLAYTKPGGLAVAGPNARIVALDTDADLDSVVSRLQEQSATDRSVRKLLEAIPEGKVVATGPVVYYHPKEEAYYWGRAWHHNTPLGKEIWKNEGDSKELLKADDPTIFVVLKPMALAVSGLGGVSIANPISHVVINKTKSGRISYAPEAVAITGPGGIAHAVSDLYIYEYVPSQNNRV